MAWMTSTYLAMAAIGASIAGSAVAYTGSVNAARSNDAIALANAQAATMAAKNQGSMQAAQAQLEAIKARKEQEAAFANAAGMRLKTEAESRAAQENIRRGREDFSKVLAQQRAATAARGVVDTTGSPLELLVKGAENQQLAEEEARYADEIARRQGFRAADLETVRGRVAGLDVGMSLLTAAAARNNAQMGATQARLNLFGERAQSQAMRTQATAGLISSAGSISRDFYSYRRSATPGGIA